MRNTVGTPHFQKRVTGVRPVTQWKLSNTGVFDFVMLLHAADQSSVFKVCGPNENRPTEGPASLSGKWEVQSKLDFSASSHPSPARGPSRKQAQYTPTPPRPNSIQIQQTSQVTRFSVHEAGATKLEPRNPVHDPRLKVRGPRTYVPGPWPSDRGPGFRQGCR